MSGAGMAQNDINHFQINFRGGNYTVFLRREELDRRNIVNICGLRFIFKIGLFLKLTWTGFK